MAFEAPHFPTTDEIRERAIEIFQEEYIRTHPDEAPPTPEESELREGSYWDHARSDLMTGIRSQLEETLSFYEGEAARLREELGEKLEYTPEEIRDLKDSLTDLRSKYRSTRKDLRRAETEKEEAEAAIREREERVRAEYAERLLAAEEMRVKMLTVRFLKDYPSFVGVDEKTYGPFKTAAIASVPEPNAAVLLERGFAEEWGRPPVAVPVPRPPPVRRREELSRSEINRLKDFFNVTLYDELGRTPRNTAAKFRVEIERVKDQSFEEAKAHIEEVAREIISREIAVKVARVPAERPPPRIRPYRPPREEEEIPLALARVPPTYPPDKPLDGPEERPFPRSMTRREEGHDGLRHGFWPAFCYRLQEQMMNPLQYQKLWKDYMYDTSFTSWKDLLKHYEWFIDSIKTGKPLPPLEIWRGGPIPYGLAGVLREVVAEPKGLREVVEPFKYNAVVWTATITIKNARLTDTTPTLVDVKQALIERGIDGTITDQDIKDVLMDAWKTPEQLPVPWFTRITLEDLNALLET